MGKTENHDLARPHDLLVRNVLADADLVADLLRNYLDPELASTLDLKSLKREAGETVSPNLSEMMGDLRYSGRFKGGGKEVKLFLFFEHQSQADRFMAFRMVGYIHAAYKRMLPSLKKGERFPYPLAVVLHHGKSPWKKIPPVRELIDTAPGMTNDILGLPIQMIDVAAMSVDNLRGHPMVCALLDSLQSTSAGTLFPRMPGILSRVSGLGKDKRAKSWMMALGKYFAFVQGKVQGSIDDLSHIFIEACGKKEGKKMAMTIAEELQREGLAKGKVEGKVEGKIEFILDALAFRFGEVPSGVRKKLSGIRDANRLEEVFKTAMNAQSLKEFQKAL